MLLSFFKSIAKLILYKINEEINFEEFMNEKEWSTEIKG